MVESALPGRYLSLLSRAHAGCDCIQAWTTWQGLPSLRDCAMPSGWRNEAAGARRRHPAKLYVGAEWLRVPLPRYLSPLQSSCGPIASTRRPGKGPPSLRDCAMPSGWRNEAAGVVAQASRKASCRAEILMPCRSSVAFACFMAGW